MNAKITLFITLCSVMYPSFAMEQSNVEMISLTDSVKTLKNEPRTLLHGASYFSPLTKLCPDGKRAVVYSKLTRNITLYDMTQKTARSTPLTGDCPLNFFFSGNGDFLLALLPEGKISLWNIRKDPALQVRKWRGLGELVDGAVSDDGCRVIIVSRGGSFANSVSFYQVGPGELKRHELEPASVKNADFAGMSPSGKYAFTYHRNDAGSLRLALWDLDTLIPVKHEKVMGTSMTISFSQSGRYALIKPAFFGAPHQKMVVDLASKHNNFLPFEEMVGENQDASIGNNGMVVIPVHNEPVNSFCLLGMPHSGGIYSKKRIEGSFSCSAALVAQVNKVFIYDYKRKGILVLECDGMNVKASLEIPVPEVLWKLMVSDDGQHVIALGKGHVYYWELQSLQM